MSNRVQKLYAGLKESDDILLSQNPTLMMPRFSELPVLTLGGRRYVVARNGLFIQARTNALALTLQMEAFSAPLPYGTLAESVSMPGGLIPREIFTELRRQAVAASPYEWAAFVVLQQREYRIVQPEVLSRSSGHISYSTCGIDESNIVLDIHSHGAIDSFFSATDDHSDLHGTYFASVLGRCERHDSVTCVSRLVIDGWYRDINWCPWEE